MLGLLAACSSAPDVASVPTVSVRPKATTAPPESAEPLMVIGADVGKVVVDGDLRDWPETVPNFLFYGVSAKGIFFAGRLDPRHDAGIYLTVGSPVPEVPMIGDWTRGGGTDPPNCDHEREYISGEWTPTEKALAPETAAACLAAVRAYDELREAHARRFQRVYRIDASGVRMRSDAGAWEPIASAPAASWKPDPEGGFQFEAGLPLSALPRLSEAPLAGLYVLPARVGPGSDPITVPSPFVSLMSISSPSHFQGELPKEEVAPPMIVPLPEPISFEPLGELRAKVFEDLSQPRAVGDLFFSTAGSSYLASDPLHVETMQGGQLAAGQSVEQLYTPEMQHGEVEIGRVQAYFTRFAIFKAGKLLDLFEAPGQEKKVLRRGDEIHIVSYQSSGYTMNFGPNPASWSVIAIGPDGTRREAVDATMEQAIAAAGCLYLGPSTFDLDMPSASESFDKLAWKGSCRAGTLDQPKDQGIEVTYQWDADRKIYAGSFRKIPVPKKAPPPKGARKARAR